MEREELLLDVFAMFMGIYVVFTSSQTEATTMPKKFAFLTIIVSHDCNKYTRYSRIVFFRSN